jgi:uncharacterized protein GlcG (DUF336 family)
MNRFVCAALLGAAFVTPAMAQRGAPPAPIGVAGHAPPVAITPDKEIPFEQAAAAAHAALETCLALPRKSQAVVMVVDLNGNVRVQLSPDGTGLPFYDYARRKAYTVLKKGMSSGDFAKLPDVAATPRGGVFQGDPQLINFPGASPIMKNGVMIGALSVSGPTGGAEDEKCTAAGMAKFHF